MNEKFKLSDEEKSQIPKEKLAEIEKGIKDGSVVAIPVPKPSMSTRLYTIAIAIIVAVMLLPIWIGASWMMTIGLGIAAIGWATIYMFETRLTAQLKLHLQIERSAMEYMMQRIDKAMEIDGTKQDETCLSEGDGGSGTVH